MSKQQKIMKRQTKTAHFQQAAKPNYQPKTVAASPGLLNQKTKAQRQKIPRQQIKQITKAGNRQTKIAQVQQAAKPNYQPKTVAVSSRLLNQKLKAQRQQRADKHRFNMAKLRLIKNKLNSGKGSSIPMIIFLIFSLICGIIVGAWYLILKPILGILNPTKWLKRLNPFKFGKK